DIYTNGSGEAWNGTDPAGWRHRSDRDRIAQLDHHPARLPDQLGPGQLALADAVRYRLLRHRVHGNCGLPLRHRPVRNGAPVVLAPPGRRADLRRSAAVQARPGDPPDLGPDAPAEVVDLDGRLRFHRRDLRYLLDGA